MTGDPTSTVLTLRPQGSRAAQQASASKARERRWAPKVKTGCQTCRSRRVKCDEAKPECQRCITGGFTCKGYPLIQKAPVTTFWAGVSTSSAPAEVTPTPGALQLSHFFRTQVVSTCYDEFSRDMWLRQYPQAAQSVPAIWHGCNAIASCWQLMAIDTTNSILKGAAEKVRQDGMRQYSHMLTELVKVAHQPTLTAADKSTILAVNLLATIYLNGTGQIADQNVIIANTANLFRRWQPWLSDSASPIPSTFILLMFLKYERYKENSTLITCQKPWLWNEALLSLQSRPLLTCTDASAELEMLSMGLQSTFPTFLNIWTDANAVAMSHATLATFRQIFISWSERLDAFKVSGRLRNEDRGPLSVLEIRRIVVGVMLQVDITRLETCWDDFEGEFNKALLLAERLLSDTTMPAFTPTLSQLLHWMAKTCLDNHGWPTHSDY
ncbi:hypothetical protein K4F52_002407 [Lecanicillium sp. MT-2017a]|nr:hypothetical protein K4F52_002407 [Lecanicillium sp. MT-2017a]